MSIHHVVTIHCDACGPLDPRRRADDGTATRARLANLALRRWGGPVAAPLPQVCDEDAELPEWAK